MGIGIGGGHPSTASDTGMTLFEESLAFAEAEALVSPLTGNVAPEVLYVATVTALAHLASNVLALVVPERQARGGGAGRSYRLLTTAVWGVLFVGGVAWGMVRAWGGWGWLQNKRSRSCHGLLGRREWSMREAGRS